MTRRITLVVLAALAIAPAACDGCAEPLNEIDDGLPIGGVDDDEPRQLTYVGQNPFIMFRGQSDVLRFTWKTESGLPVAGDAISVNVEGTVASVSNGTFTTDAGGGISVGVNAAGVDGEATVVARATDVDGTIDEARVTVRVQEDPEGALVVTVQSQARIPVRTAAARILVGTNPPTCQQLTLSPEPAAQASGSYATVPGTQRFDNLPAGKKAVVIADGMNASGAVVARGCVDFGVIAGGRDNTVTIVLGQGDTIIEGEYDVLMHMALGDALPEPYDSTIELLTALLADPAGYAIYVVLREIDRQTGFTFFVTRDGVEQRFRDLEADPSNFPTWNLARTELDQLLADQLGQTYVDVTNVGAGIRDVVTDFEVGARLDLDDTDQGLLIDESWRDLVLYWPLPCDDGDLACARRPLRLADANLAPIVTSYEGSVSWTPVTGTSERFVVETDPHGLDVRYGALVLAILEQVVFPSLPPSVAGDSFGDVLSNMVGCANIGASLSSDPIAGALVAGLCEVALDVAAQEVEDRLTDLQIDAANPALGEEGLTAGGSFVLTDADQDLTTELVGAYHYDLAWYDPNDPAFTADIAAPITGDGLRFRTVCVDDAACGAGKACVARGSYLKIAAVEMGCERAKGSLAGGAACTGDTNCASGLCAPVGSNDALVCYEACDATADCAAGMACTDLGATLDLDTVLDGLGSVAVPGCSAP